jgi:hypothetical protein
VEDDLRNIGYITYHGYCAKTIAPTMEPITAQVLLQLLHENGVVTMVTKTKPSWYHAD